MKKRNSSKFKTADTKEIIAKRGLYIVLAICIIGIGAAAVIGNQRRSAQTAQKRLDEEMRRLEEVFEQHGRQTPPPVRTPLPSPIPTPAPTPFVRDEPVVPAASLEKLLVLTPPLQGRIMKAFSANDMLYSNTLQDWRTHLGIDIECAANAEVFAVADGIVERAYVDDEMGNTVVISHKNDFKSVYSNLTSIDTSMEGKAISQGSLVGTVGESAAYEYADPPHLHFEFLKNGVHVDPAEYMQFDPSPGI